MCILIARFNHKTSTFPPVSTPLASSHPRYGANAYRAAKGARTTADASIDLARTTDAEIVVPVVTGASLSGHVAAETYATLCDTTVATTLGCDALLLDLHGTVVMENSDDGEGDLLEYLRAMVLDIPTVVVLDLYGNPMQKFIDLTDIVVNLKMYPHVDMYETGEHAGRLLFNKLAGRANPVLMWRRLPMVTRTLRSHTDEGAMHRTVVFAKQAEADDISAVPILAGSGLADIAMLCLSVVVVGNDDKHAAGVAAQRTADVTWRDRGGFVYHSEPLTESIARAAGLTDVPGNGPVLLLDHSDNCMSDDTYDDMHVLHEALR